LPADMRNDGIDPLQLVPPLCWDSASNKEDNCPLIDRAILGQFAANASTHAVVWE
jgi:hypothetical protein